MNNLNPCKDQKLHFVITHLSHLFYSVSVTLLQVAAIFTGLGLSDYTLKMKKMLPLQQNGFYFTSKASHSLCFEEKRMRECMCSALYLDFYLNLGIPGLLFLSFSCNSSLIFFKSNKPPSQTLIKESQPWRSPGLGREAGLILVAGEPLKVGTVVRGSPWHVLPGPSCSTPLSPEPLGGQGKPSLKTVSAIIPWWGGLSPTRRSFFLPYF